MMSPFGHKGEGACNSFNFSHNCFDTIDIDIDCPELRARTKFTEK